MRAWTIVLFVIAVHACLSMFNVADITNTTGVWVETSGTTHNFVVHQGKYDVNLPDSNLFFNSSANGSEIYNKQSSLTSSNGGFVGKMIEQIIGAADVFGKLLTMFSNVVFSIHYLASPIFGDYNAWVLEGVVDIVVGIGLFQMITGRSFKTMD